VDWDRYEWVRDGKEAGTKSLMKLAGSRFKFANRAEDESAGGDGLYILSPDAALVDEANGTQEFNDASYVVLYRSKGGKVLLPGDAHDKTWQFVLDHYEEDVKNVSLLIAPHHGRKSGRDYSFLDVVKPKLTLFGCAPSGDLAYDAWNYRDLAHITNNQAGSITAECDDEGMDIFVENRNFAAAAGGEVYRTHWRTGFFFLGRVPR